MGLTLNICGVSLSSRLRTDQAFVYFPSGDVAGWMGVDTGGCGGRRAAGGTGGEGGAVCQPRNRPPSGHATSGQMKGEKLPLRNPKTNR